MGDLRNIATSQGIRTVPWLTLGAALVLLAGYVVLGPAPEALIYDRSALAQGEFWRLITGHLVHGDWAHLGWNLGAFVVLGALYEIRFRPSAGRYLALYGVAALAVDAWLWCFEPGLARYCGLSGVLNATWAVLAIRLWYQTGSRLFLAFLAADGVKIAVEWGLGDAVLPTSTLTSVPGAHFAGLLAGLALVAWQMRGLIPAFHRDSSPATRPNGLLWRRG